MPLQDDVLDHKFYVNNSPGVVLQVNLTQYLTAVFWLAWGRWCYKVIAHSLSHATNILQ